jgi:hypothetical protein
MNEEFIDNSIVRSTADDLRRSAAKVRQLEAALVVVTAIAIMFLGGTILAASNTNRRGVNRIIDCTTPGRACYEDEKARSNALVADALISLNEEHLVIECLLQQPTLASREVEFPKCKQQAADMTAVQRAALQKAAGDARKRAEQGKP